jgi:predicted transcriptional regulator
MPDMDNGGMENTAVRLRKRLMAHKGRFQQLAKVSGVPVSTIYKISGGYVQNPGIGTSDRLFAGLEKMERQ